MKTLLLILTIGTAQAALTTFTDLDTFTLATPEVMQTSAIGQTVVLYNFGQAPLEFSTGSPMTAAGLTVDTRPAGPGAGFNLAVRYGAGGILVPCRCSLRSVALQRLPPAIRIFPRIAPATDAARSRSAPPRFCCRPALLPCPV